MRRVALGERLLRRELEMLFLGGPVSLGGGLFDFFFDLDLLHCRAAFLAALFLATIRLA